MNKTRKLKLLAFLFLIFGLLLWTQSAWANLYGENQVINGDFETGSFSPWITSGPIQIGFDTDGNKFAVTGGGNSASLYQVIDEAAFPAWDPQATGKLWSFKAGYDVWGYMDTSLARFALYYYPSNPETQPGFDPNNTSGWTNFLDYSVSGNNTYQTQGMITGLDPRWVAVFIQLSTQAQGSGAVVDNIDFEARAVPLPGAVWLLGSGLLGLGAVGWRRRQG